MNLLIYPAIFLCFAVIAAILAITGPESTAYPASILGALYTVAFGITLNFALRRR